MALPTFCQITCQMWTAWVQLVKKMKGNCWDCRMLDYRWDWVSSIHTCTFYSDFSFTDWIAMCYRTHWLNTYNNLWTAIFDGDHILPASWLSFPDYCLSRWIAQSKWSRLTARAEGVRDTCPHPKDSTCSNSFTVMSILVTHSVFTPPLNTIFLENLRHKHLKASPFELKSRNYSLKQQFVLKINKNLQSRLCSIRHSVTFLVFSVFEDPSVFIQSIM